MIKTNGIAYRPVQERPLGTLGKVPHQTINHFINQQEKEKDYYELQKIGKNGN
jgi:hypothetical protein